MKLDYTTVWRWHFYAGLFFAPVFVFLAVTGSIYLFDEEIDTLLHGDLYRVQAQGNMLSPSEQLRSVHQSRPAAAVEHVQPSPRPGVTSRVGIRQDGRSTTIFVNPHSGAVVGSLVPSQTLTERVRDLHEKFLAGTVGNWIVEAAASWLVVMLLTGLYLWWPRGRWVRGTLLPRFGGGERTFWRDLHAVTGFWLALFLLFQTLAGLAWTDVWGNAVKRLATSAGGGFPAAVPFNPPEAQTESTVPTKELTDEVPWALENVPVPPSSPEDDPRISLANVVDIAERNDVPAPYTIRLPQSTHGVYTVTASLDRPQNSRTLHIDQYSGDVLVDVGFEDYGVVAKAISIGIKIHQGDYFGWPNKILILSIALGLILMVGSAGTMWWKRKPDGALGAPRVSEEVDLSPWAVALVLGLGILLPLFGATLLIALAIDYGIIRRVPAADRWIK